MNHKARNVLLKCVAALAISSVISWGLIDSANHRVRVRRHRTIQENSKRLQKTRDVCPTDEKRRGKNSKIRER